MLSHYYSTKSRIAEIFGSFLAGSACPRGEADLIARNTLGANGSHMVAL
jgi:hypothetical protein